MCNLSVTQFAVQEAGRQALRTDWMRRFISPGLSAFETLLDDFDQTPYCIESAPSLADICLIPQLYNARRWDTDYQECTKIRSIETACAAHPAFAAAHPDQIKPD